MVSLFSGDQKFFCDTRKWAARRDSKSSEIAECLSPADAETEMLAIAKH